MSRSLNPSKPLVAAGIRSREVIIRGPSNSSHSVDDVAEETAIAMVYNGISHAVMMATPLDLEDFALGFSLSEGIISDKDQCYGIDIVRSKLGFECQINIPSASFMSLKQRRRQLAGRTGCGICGIESLAAVVPDLGAIKQAQVAVNNTNNNDKKSNTLESPIHTQLPSFTAVDRALKQLHAQQALRAKCGAVHAAAFACVDGHIHHLREDVGRHNALDKLLGALAKVPNSTCQLEEGQREGQGQQNGPQGFIVVSSRASYEMVYKTAIRGINTLIATSAPTAMAIELAEQANMNVIGFVREGRQLIYCQASYQKAELS